jgi:hypothetical protein
MNDNEIIDKILKIIGRDDELMTQFSTAIGIDEEDLGDFIDNVEFPIIGRKNRHSV